MSFQKQGFEIITNFISTEKCKYLISEIEDKFNSFDNYAIRNIDKKINSIACFALSTYLLNSANYYLNANPILVSAIYFNKTINTNWSVTWHQDKTIAVDKRVELPGYKTWTIKDKINYVQPPLTVLENIVTFRIHLDAASKINGCLKVIPGTHKLGILSQSEINKIKNTYPQVACEVDAGDLIVMRPYILHSSQKSSVPKNRRVLHLEYSSIKLPEPLAWAE
ncbi:MAG: phytanoyl-CoA dioxygenase family protein [Rivularia sp. ALOHA_DT_140]|nr:phytanoyl-CoA dioxygenase family protein [Rivularia sp. ALOHA_DT_140]